MHIDTAIKTKLSNKFWCKKVMFHQDNARSHVSVFTGWNLYGL